MTQIPHFSETPVLPKLKDVIMGLCLYFGIQLFLMPLVMRFMHPYFSEAIPLWRTWGALIGLFLAALTLLGYTYMLIKRYGIAIWSLSKAPPLSRTTAFFYGALCWPLTAFCIWVVITLVQLIFPDLFSMHQIDQIAVQQLKESSTHPLLFIAMLLSVLVLAPVSEELLFRGLVQRMLLRRCSLWVAIAGTACFFALLHCSSAQGTRNIEIFLALFILACVQGYLYETTQQLTAPLGLHVCFNLATVIMLFYTQELPLNV